MRGDRSHRLKHAVETLRSDLARQPGALRQYALELVRDLGRGAGALWYELGMVDGHPLPTRHASFGAPVDLGVQLAERIPWPTTDPRLPPKHWNRSFLLLSSVVGAPEEVLWSTRLFNRLWRPSKMIDQVRMVVYHRGEHVAWLGAIQREGEPRFSRADQRRLAPVADALADALITARAVERAADVATAGDLLVDPRGNVEYASPETRPWLDKNHSRSWLREWVRAVDRSESASPYLEGRRVRWSRVYSESGRMCYLLHLEPTTPVPVHPSFVLSRMQREVAMLASAGATSAEIATMCEIAPSTVRAHLKQIYALLEISSRAELGRLLAEAAPFVEGTQTLAELRALGRPKGTRGTASPC